MKVQEELKKQYEKELEEYPLLLTHKEVQAIFRTGKNGIYRYINAGLLHPIKQEKKVLFSKVDVIECLTQLTITSLN